MAKQHLKRLFAIFGAVLFGGSLLAGCAGQQDPPEQSEPQHTHTYSYVWSQDAYYHWRASTCGHADEVGDMGLHAMKDGVCTVCGYERTPEHTRRPVTTTPFEGSYEIGDVRVQLLSDTLVRIEDRTENGMFENRESWIVTNRLAWAGTEGEAAFGLNDRVSRMLMQAFPQLKLANGEATTVGGLVGLEATKSSVLAIVLALIGMSIYVTLRFELTFAAAGTIALVHDVIVSLGIFILMGRELSLPVVAALLTIIGYSINDTIVIFDRIREDAKLYPGENFHTLIDAAINRTLSRTLLTSVTTFLVVAVMFCFGGIVINDFVLVMMLGIVIGTYSSVFLASPMVVAWHRKIGVNHR